MYNIRSHTHTHTSLLLYYPVLIAARQTHQALWASEGLLLLLLPLIHGGRLSSTSTQRISTVSMNIWTDLPPVYISHETSLLNSGCAALIDDTSVLWKKKGGGGGGGEGRSCDNCVLNAGRNRRRRFHSVAPCWWMFALCCKNGKKSVLVLVAWLWLMVVFK